MIPSPPLHFINTTPSHSLHTHSPLSLSSPEFLSPRRSMASVTAAAVAAPGSVRFRPAQALQGMFNRSSVSFAGQKKTAPMRLHVSCAAKQETVTKVCEIVKKQLSLPDGTSVTGESKFSDLGADSLDTVEIVMGLEEAFDITVEEENASSITTVQNAADLIEKLIEGK